MGGEGVVVASMWSFNRCRPSQIAQDAQWDARWTMGRGGGSSNIYVVIQPMKAVLRSYNRKCLNKNDILFQIEQKYCGIIFINIIIIYIPIIIILYGAGGISSSLRDTGMDEKKMV